MDNKAGERIRHLRECRELTQKQLAKAVNVSESVIKKLEIGERGITVQMLNAAADYFQVSTDYLLGRVEVPYPDVRIQAISKATGLSDTAVAILMEESSEIQTEDIEPCENAEEMQELLNLLIPCMPWSYMLKEFSNLLVIYKSSTQFETNGTKGCWIDIDGELSNTVTMGSGEAVEFLLYRIASEVSEMLKDAMNWKYGDHMTKGGRKNAPKDNP